jgi:phage tail sheath protein FI
MAQKTPGVYIEEISKFPPSVAEVETAVPAFIGYTEKAEWNGENLHNVPSKIMSLLEYERRFGGEQALGTVKVTVNPDNNYAVEGVDLGKRYYMYEALKLFFDNGGGKCYIVSVGLYKDNKIASGDENKTDDSAPGLRVGLKRLEKYDEPTIILFPDAVALDMAELFGLQQLALSQCARLQDRVGLFDLPEAAGWDKAVGGFRDSIGTNNLKYGAAYTPWLRSSYARDVDFGLFANSVQQKDGTKVALEKVSGDSAQNELVRTAQQAADDASKIEAVVAGLRGGEATVRDRYLKLKRDVAAGADDDAKLVGFQTLVAGLHQAILGLANGWGTAFSKSPLRNDLLSYGSQTLGKAVEALIGLEKTTDFRKLSGEANAAAIDTLYHPVDALGWLGNKAPNVPRTAADVPVGSFGFAGEADVSKQIDLALRELDKSVLGSEKSLLRFVDQMQGAAAARKRTARDALYERHPIVRSIVEAIKRKLAEVPPSGAVAGVYASVDRTRGVWKAPANVSLASVLEPMEQIDFFEQEDLNVDVTGGKSINAIRTFTGLGTLVWGARTLAGNDNEWRYVPVRRFFNMVEESVKKSTNWAVFEPNDANLWTKVKGMIENYLIQKWREGALQGATPDKAFYVKIGLGETMIAQDILEGRLVVEIGMAVVRPAEFIILKFSHKMPEA